MKKLFCAAALLSVSAFAGTPVEILAKILASRGVITTEDLNRVEAASPEDGVSLLAELLREKGVLTETDAARVEGLASSPIQMAMTPAAAHPVLPSSNGAPSSGPAASGRVEAPPVTAKSNVPITVYGTILLNSFFDTAGTNNMDVPLLLTKQGTDPLGGDKSFGMTARQSRFGATINGPDIAGATTTGVFEFDLFGGQSALPNAAGFDLFRLRLAYARIDWQNVSLTAGQDWSIFAPLNPASFADFAIPEFAASGNPWIRVPQLRLDIRQELGAFKVLYQMSAIDPNLGDYPATQFLTATVPGIGERGRAPAFEGRVALTRSLDGRDATVGFSAHYGHGKNSGEVGNTYEQVPVNSWGTSIDYIIPVASKLNWTGESYIGRALGLYSVGLGEDILPVGGPGQYGVLSYGGWSQLQYLATKKIQLNAGFGVDAERARDLPVGDRYSNASASASLFCKWSPAVTFAWEYRRMLTNYRNQAYFNEQGDNVNMAVAYTF